MNILLGATAFAETLCIGNGKCVDEARAVQEAALGLGIGFGIVLGVIVLAALIFWLKMLIHAIKTPIEQKPLWILILLLFHIVGAIVYYFAVKKENKNLNS